MTKEINQEGTYNIAVPVPSHINVVFILVANAIERVAGKKVVVWKAIKASVLAARLLHEKKD